ncbi:MAG: hypothetical protein AB7O26_01580 [Planctomycetaceae bacterium]
MTFAENGSSSDLILLGFFGVFLALAFWIRSLVVRRARAELSATSADAQDDPQAADRAAARIDRFELRLHEYSRDVEARVETRLARLDRLVVSADREICRLQDLLEPKGRSSSPNGPDIVHGEAASGDVSKRDPLTSWQRRMVVHLREAGYNAREVAVLLDRPETEITAALEIERQDEARGVA